MILQVRMSVEVKEEHQNSTSAPQPTEFETVLDDEEAAQVIELNKY